MKHLIIAAAIAALVPAAAFAAETSAQATRADVPAASAELPADLKAYVTTHDAIPLNYTGKVALGHGLDGELVYEQIPSFPAYRWAYLNGQKVVVEKKTGHVVAVY